MNGDKFILDTNTVINYLNDKITLPDGGDNGDVEFFISVITELELFSKPDITPDEESKISGFLNDNVTVVNIDTRIKNETIAIRRTTKIKLPDCIIAATSIVLGQPSLPMTLGICFPWPSPAITPGIFPAN